MESRYNIGDKRGEDGTVLEYLAVTLAREMAIQCTKIIKNHYAYSLIAKNIDSSLIDFYYKVFFYKKLNPLARKIVIQKWNKVNRHPINLSELNIGNFPLALIIKKMCPDAYLNTDKILFKYPLELDLYDDFFSLAKKNFNNDFTLSCVQILYKIKRIIKPFYNQIKSLKRYIYFSIIPISYVNRFNSSGINVNPTAIAINYVEGIELNKRPDIFWFPKSDMDPSSVLIYFDSKYLANRFGKLEKIISKIEELGFKWVVLYQPPNKLKDHYWWPKSKWFSETIQQNIKNLKNFSPEDQIGNWLKKEGLELLKKANYWHAFFKQHNVKIHNDIKEDMLVAVKSIAIDLAGGCSFGKERGYISYPDGFFSCYPNHIFFTWGSKSARNYILSKNIDKNVLISGFPHDLNITNTNKSKNPIKDKLVSNGAKFIVLLLDNNHTMNKALYQTVYTPVMNQFYEEFLKWVLSDSDLGLIIKPKKPVTLKTLPAIENLLEKAVNTGRCYNVPDPFRTQPEVFTSISNFVVSTGVYFSSALIETVLKGVRGVFYDYPNLRSSEPSLYEWGGGNVIFDDLDQMMVALKRYKNDPIGKSSIGDWSAHLDEIDPFRDDSGGKRIGTYIRWLQAGFDEGLDRAAVISMANRRYADAWGEDKVHFTEYNS